MTSEHSRSGRRLYWLAALLLVGAATRVWFLIEHARNLPFLRVPDQDAAYYDAWAQTLAGGGVFTHGAFTMAPGYPYFLAGVYTLFGRDPLHAVVFQAVLGLGTLAVTFLLALRWFGLGEAVIGGFLLTGYGTVYFYEAKLLAPTLATFLTVLLVWLVDRATRTPRGVTVHGRGAWSLAAGVTAGALAVVRANLLPAGLLIALGLAWSARKRSGLRGVPVWYAVGLGLALAPTTAHNARNGAWAPVATNGAVNFYAGNWSGANGGFRDTFGLSGNIATQAAEADSLVRADLGRSLTPGATERYWMRRALREIAADPVRWLGLEFTKLRLLAAPAEETVNGSYALEATRVSALRVFAVPFNLLFIPGLVGLALAVLPGHRRRGSALAPVSVIVAVVVTALGFFVISRFRLPAAPLLAVYSGHALVRGAEALRARRPLRPALVAAATAGVCVLAWRSPLGSLRNPVWEAGLFARAAAKLETSNPHEATAAYHDALALDPARNDVRMGFVQFLVRTGDLPGAAAEMERAVANQPSDPDLRSNYGILLFGLGRWAECAAEMRMVTAAEPGRAVPHLYLGLAALRSDDTVRAEAELTRAQELDPKLKGSYLGLMEIARARGDTAAVAAWSHRARENGVAGEP